ncbi:hypothetical protein EKO27_g4396 [Xylaria grammica]|uniref:Uncharacterized protein n=1 Tax=Xylaria grammica TaxID=363999 RepID=A0A439D8J6_9PEZI|nr:hypothetical protein EKO27_g4396 [Xylaria grammica]
MSPVDDDSAAKLDDIYHDGAYHGRGWIGDGAPVWDPGSSSFAVATSNCFASYHQDYLGDCGTGGPRLLVLENREPKFSHRFQRSVNDGGGPRVLGDREFSASAFYRDRLKEDRWPHHSGNLPYLEANERQDGSFVATIHSSL